ncbi:MAG: virulence factor family protein [Rhodospirillales bacterium]|nr:virulence factor family protein [Rhodospirillales bacterium]
MRRYLLLLPVLAVAACNRETTMDDDLLGKVAVFAPEHNPTGFVFLLSDAKGWAPEMSRLAKHLRRHGLIVAGIDSVTLLANLAKDNAVPCHTLTGAFETMSQTIQKEHALAVYALPVLAGIGDGAVVALAALWQTGPQTFSGAVTADFVPVLRSIGPLCADPPAEPANGGVYVYSAPPGGLSGGWWQAAWSTPPEPATREFAKAAGAATPLVHTSIASPTALLGKLLDWSTAERARRAVDALKLGDLSVVDLPGRTGSTDVAIILSGDGGWRDLDRSLGEILAATGVHVIGIDCLRYFWHEKSPGEVAADLARLIAQIINENSAAKISLIGYSFGADVLPAILKRLPTDTRSRIVFISLLALGKDAHFEIKVSGWFGGDSTSDAQPLSPELAGINVARVQCIYGEDETDESGCLDRQLQGADIVHLPGGHHFDEDYSRLAEIILRRMRATS